MDRRKMTSILIMLEAGLLCVVILFAVVLNRTGTAERPMSTEQGEQTIGTENSQSSESIETEIDLESTESTEDEGIETREIFSMEVEQKLVSMTTEQKVAQLFLTTPEEVTGTSNVTDSGDSTKDALAQYPVGGLVYEKNNFMGTAQAEELINGAQEHCQASNGLTLFVVVQENAPSYASFATLSIISQDNGAVATEISDAPALPDGIKVCTYTTGLEVIAAINDGMDMVYAPDDFVEIYAQVLAAVNEGTISQVRLEDAVGRVLSEKLQ